MKVIGKTKEGYIVTMTEPELNAIAFNKDNNTFHRDDEEKIKNNPEIKIHEQYRHVMSFKHNSEFNSEYSSIRRKLQNMLNNLKPIEEFIKIEQAKLKAE